MDPIIVLLEFTLQGLNCFCFCNVFCCVWFHRVDQWGGGGCGSSISAFTIINLGVFRCLARISKSLTLATIVFSSMTAARQCALISAARGSILWVDFDLSSINVSFGAIFVCQTTFFEVLVLFH